MPCVTPAETFNVGWGVGFTSGVGAGVDLGAGGGGTGALLPKPIGE
jgi:hypothetical protein